MLAKKKAFSDSTVTDQEVVKIQSEVTGLLNTLEESTFDNEEPHCQQVEKIESLIKLVEVCSAECNLEASHETPSCPPMNETQMDELIDNLLTSEGNVSQVLSSSCAVNGLGDTQNFSELEDFFTRIEACPEADLDIFAEDEEEQTLEESSRKSDKQKLFPVFIKGATAKQME